VPMRFS